MTNTKHNKKGFLTASTIGTNFLANVLVGGLIGYALDYYLHNKLLFFIFFFLGVLSGMRAIYYDTKKLLKEQDIK